MRSALPFGSRCRGPLQFARLKDLARAVKEADKTIVFAQTVLAATRAVQVFGAEGVERALLTSDMHTRDRKKILVGFEDGKHELVAAPKLLDEGFDVAQPILRLFWRLVARAARWSSDWAGSFGLRMMVETHVLSSCSLRIRLKIPACLKKPSLNQWRDPPRPSSISEPKLLRMSLRIILLHSGFGSVGRIVRPRWLICIATSLAKETWR